MEILLDRVSCTLEVLRFGQLPDLDELITLLSDVQTNLQQSADAEAAARETKIKRALNCLSYSEMEGLQTLMHNSEGDEIFIIASKIADAAGITRSVIVSALRKMESANLMEGRSLGMKGMRIKLLDPELRQAILNAA